MREVVYGQMDRFLPWAASRMPFTSFEFPDEAATIAVVDGESILAVAVYHNYYPQWKTVSMSIAADEARWASKKIFGIMLAFPFFDLKCERITTWQPEWHEKARKLVQGVGFIEEGRMRKGFGDCDTIILGLLRKDAEPWLQASEHPAYSPYREEIPHGQA